VQYDSEAVTKLYIAFKKFEDEMTDVVPDWDPHDLLSNERAKKALNAARFAIQEFETAALKKEGIKC
jgi:hypothetical protein